MTEEALVPPKDVLDHNENADSLIITKSGIDNSSLDSLQNLAEASLDCLEESVSCSNVSTEDSCVPGPLPKEGRVLSKIKESLLGLIAKCEAEEEEEVAISYFRPQRYVNNEVQKAALLSHTIGAYISALDKPLVCRIALQLVSDTTLWISKIFRFFDSLAYFSRDSREGLIRVIRMVLHSRYLRYSTTGYEALFTRPPVIYYCDPDAHGIGKHLSHLCSQLGLPLSCITTVPCLSNTVEGQFKMDPAALERCIQEDLSATRTPLLVIANAGSNILGHIDPLQKIQEVCLSHNVHLHVQGHSLAALSLVSVPNLPSNLGDSMTLRLGDWIGLPSIPFITLYKAKEMSHVVSAGLNQASTGQLDFLPVWFAVQTLGYDTLTQMIRHSFHLSDILLQKLETFTELRILSKKRSPPKEGHHYEVSSIGDRSIPTMVLFDALTSVLAFQFTPKSSQSVESIDKNPPYYDNLNSWLVQVMAREVPSVKTEILELANFGVCLRICFLENAHILNTTTDDVENYFLRLQEQIEIINSTVTLKQKLLDEHKNYPKLQLVDILDWAGMGGVRYIPDLWLDRLNELTDTGKADINHLNSELVTKLKVSDSAFSLGEADDGMLCVRFGMVDAHLDLEELMNLVSAAGQEIEESSKLLVTMSEIVKQGIEEANKELIQENQEKIMQEGVLRQVPVIGSFVSWWYPAPKEVGIKGRSFNLASGTIESTENIYKYHMQVKETSKGLSRTSSQSSNPEQQKSPSASP